MDTVRDRLMEASACYQAGSLVRAYNKAVEAAAEARRAGLYKVRDFAVECANVASKESWSRFWAAVDRGEGRDAHKLAG